MLTTVSRSVYPSAGTDESLSKQLPDTIRIDRVPHKNPERTLLLARDKFCGFLCNSLFFGKSQLRAVSSRDTSGEPAAAMCEQYLAMRTAMLERLFSFPDPQCFWLRPAVQRLAQIPRNEFPDVVFATGGPWTSLLVGRALAKNFRVPFVADFRDPWTNNPNREFPSTSLERKHRDLERAVCAAAARVIVNTEELRAQFRLDNPTLKEKFITITNGFDNDHRDSCSGLTNGKHQLSVSRPIIELCHFGSIYGNRNPLPLLLAVENLFKEKRIREGQLRIRFVGEWEQPDDRCESLAKELERHGFLKRDPSVSHELCEQQMTLAQTLLILQPAYPLQVPAKIYEYIAAGRPILVIGGEGATAALVERHQLGKCCPNKVLQIKNLLLCLVEDRVQIGPPKPEEVARFDYRNLTRELAQVFDAIATDSPE